MDIYVKMEQFHLLLRLENIAYGIQRLYLKLGHIFSIVKTKRPPTTIIQDTYRIVGKLEKMRTQKSFIEGNYVWFEPMEIVNKYEGSTKVYNFEVEHDNSYCVENVLVHNCQSFSIAGRRKKDDPRNNLFEEFVRYINYFNPKAFLMENVIGILSKTDAEGNKIIDIILSRFEENYVVKICKLYASDFYVPQNRRRVIIFGIRKDLNIIPEEPQPELSIEERIPVRNVLFSKDEIDEFI